MTTAEQPSEESVAVPAVGIPLDRQVRAIKPWPQYVASFLLNDMAGACKRRGTTVPECGIDPAHIGYLLRLNWEGHIDRKIARASLEFMLDQASEMREFLDYACDKIKEHAKRSNAESNGGASHPTRTPGYRAGITQGDELCLD